MINVIPIEFPGIENVLNNSEYYKDKLISDSVICFRNANLTEKEHSQPLKAQGLSWSQRYGGGRGMGQNPPTPALVAGGARAIQLHMLMLHYCKNLFNTSS